MSRSFGSWFTWQTFISTCFGLGLVRRGVEDTELCRGGFADPEWSGRASMESAPGVRHSEDTVPHASPLSPQLTGTCFPVCSHPRWADGFGPLLHSFFSVFTAALPKASFFSDPQMSPPRRSLPGPGWLEQPGPPQFWQRLLPQALCS